MKYCKRCVQPDTRPGIIFNTDQVCMACVIAEQRQSWVDWSRRRSELLSIVEWTKRVSTTYDCVVGVSGGKDTTFQALYARDILGLNCLLVNCAPDNISDVGRYNLENLVRHGFDMISMRPNSRVERHLSKRAFFEYGNFVKPLEYSLYASAFRIASKFGIPLVIEGENPGETLGVDGFAIIGDAMQWRNANTVKDDVSIWLDDVVAEKDLFMYEFPWPGELDDMKAIFLGYYVEEWSNANNTAFAIRHGLKGRSNADPLREGRTNRYFSLDSDLKIINQNILKYFKFGYGAVTDEVCYDIRQGLLTRDQGIRLVQMYDGKCSDKYVNQFCEYIEITLTEFWDVVNSYVDKALFCYDIQKGRWSPNFTVGRDFDSGVNGIEDKNFCFPEK